MATEPALPCNQPVGWRCGGMSGRGVALVTGASSGIGEATAAALQRDGFRVYAGARRIELMDRLRELGICPLRLDVTDDGSMLDAVELIHREAGRIDLLVHRLMGMLTVE